MDLELFLTLPFTIIISCISNGLPYIIHVKKILFNQKIRERISMITGTEEVNFPSKGGDLYMYLCF